MTIRATIHSKQFYTAADGAMTFWCPVTGGTTANASYPRSELRELIDPRNSAVNWSANGTHVLRAQCRVLQVPSTGKIIVGQIHGYDSQPLVKLVWKQGEMYATVKSSPTGDADTKYDLPGVALDGIINYEIKVINGVASITVNGTTVSHPFLAGDETWANVGLYFKAGAYVQDNVGDASEAGMVAFYELTTMHSANSSSAPRIVGTMDPSRRYICEVVGLANFNYVLEASTNLSKWSAVATNRSDAGIIRFTNASGLSRRFFRVRQL